jgi:hypothetical protein
MFNFLTSILILSMILASSASADIDLSNEFVRLTISGPSMTGLQVGSTDFAKDLKPEFWQAIPETQTTKSGSAVTISPLEITEYQPILPSAATDNPAKLLPGEMLTAGFSVGPGMTFGSLSVKLPTWHAKDSSATLSLLQDGKIIATKRLENVEDNSWPELTLDKPMGEGTYTVELSDPKGDIGWWSSKDGKERALQVHASKRMGTGTLNISLDRNKIKVEAEYHLTSESSYKAFPWRWKTTWTKDGYDCTPKAGIVFSRFYTDNQRYMPIQQLKRRPNGGLQFDGFKWVEMDGNADADFRLEPAGHLHWEMTPDEMSLRFDAPVEKIGDGWKSEFTLEVKPRDDSIPSEFPHFSCSDKAVEADLNRFWWERGFTYPYPPSGSAEWMEWTALIRSWMRNEAEPANVRHLLQYPITSEGYVHTWGASLGWPLVPNRDTRHFDTNARFILGCWRHWLWTGDTDFLRKQADRLRSAMNYQLEVLRGKDGLIITPDFRTGRHEDLSDNYWDILPFGHLDAYANAIFYASLEAMAQIEDAISDHSSLITHHSSSYYRSLMRKSHRRYDEVFWDDKAGRFIGCVDIDGVRHDYGFTFVNLEALFYGLGDADKARRIYQWMEREPTSSGKADTYSKFIFAPRATTIHNPQWGEVSSDQSTVNSPESGVSPSPPRPIPPSPPPWWTYWWPGTPYGDQCQDGGAILYTSFFDLMARTRHLGADNAWKRFTEIMDRYRMPDRLCGGSPLFRGEVPQQESAGAVGTDYPFPESGLVPLYFLYGVMGIEATPDGLKITPNLPKALSYAEVKYLDWHGTDLKVRVTRDSVEVTSADKFLHRKFTIKPGQGVTLKSLVAR